MNWPDERYVRFYTRDTVTWKRWSWQARAAFGLLLRKVDRAGVLDTGAGNKAEAVALLLEVPLDVARQAVNEWLISGTLVETATTLVLPSFIEAQESTQTDAARQRESRARRRAASMQNTEAACHKLSQPVTDGHEVSQVVTPAVPSRAVPSRALKAHTSVARAQEHPLQVVWNAHRAPSMPEWRETSPTRWAHADARLKERDLEAWAAVVKRIAASDFASGRQGGWVASVDWLVKSPNNAAKVLEGNYDNRAGATKPSAPVAAESVDWTKQQTGEIEF